MKQGIGGVKICLFVLRTNHPKAIEIKEEQTGRWEQQNWLNVPNAALLLFLTEYVRLADATTRKRLLN